MSRSLIRVCSTKLQASGQMAKTGHILLKVAGFGGVQSKLRTNSFRCLASIWFLKHSYPNKACLFWGLPKMMVFTLGFPSKLQTNNKNNRTRREPRTEIASAHREADFDAPVGLQQLPHQVTGNGRGPGGTPGNGSGSVLKSREDVPPPLVTLNTTCSCGSK